MFCVFMLSAKILPFNTIKQNTFDPYNKTPVEFELSLLLTAVFVSAMLENSKY